jgi:hypothetical protein
MKRLVCPTCIVFFVGSRSTAFAPRARHHRHIRTKHQPCRRTSETSRSKKNQLQTNVMAVPLSELAEIAIDDMTDLWQAKLSQQPYTSPLLWTSNKEFKKFIDDLYDTQPNADHLWEQIRLEAISSLEVNAEAGPLLYQGILSQKSLLEAIVTVIARKFIKLTDTVSTVTRKEKVTGQYLLKKIIMNLHSTLSLCSKTYIYKNKQTTLKQS